LGVTAAQLEDAAKAVGPTSVAVRKHLGKRRSIRMFRTEHRRASSVWKAKSDRLGRSGGAAMHRAAVSAAVIFALSGCGGGNTASSVQAPGAEDTAKTRALETGAAVLQDRPPVDAINAYLDGFHFYNGQMKVQMEAHHYCAILNEDVIQCMIYDGNVKDAKLMGVEYIISETLFAGLPEQEKALWHSHVQEVKSGQRIAQGFPRGSSSGR
jgi:hypothetical protein